MTQRLMMDSIKEALYITRAAVNQGCSLSWLRNHTVLGLSLLLQIDTIRLASLFT